MEELLDTVFGLLLWLEVLMALRYEVVGRVGLWELVWLWRFADVEVVGCVG